MDEAACKELMRPCKASLKRLRETENLPREEKVNALKECLSNIGGRIGHLLTDEFAAVSQAERERQERHLWSFVTFFWPRPVRRPPLLCLACLRLTSRCAGRVLEAARHLPEARRPGHRTCAEQSICVEHQAQGSCRGQQRVAAGQGRRERL